MDAGELRGDPDAVAEHLERYRQAGLEYALCAFESEDLDDLLRQMRLFAERSFRSSPNPNRCTTFETGSDNLLIAP